MANMSYCRFSNTASDLENCYDHWEYKVSEEEEKAREEVLRIAKMIVRDFGDDGDDS
jgi:hypothetical protein